MMDKEYVDMELEGFILDGVILEVMSEKDQSENLDNRNSEFNELDWISVNNKLEQNYKNVQARWSKEIEEAYFAKEHFEKLLAIEIDEANLAKGKRMQEGMAQQNDEVFLASVTSEAELIKETKKAHCLFDLEAWDQLDGDFDVDSVCGKTTDNKGLPKVIFKDTSVDLFLRTLDAYASKPSIKAGVLEAEKVEAKVSNIHLYDVVGKEYKLVESKLPHHFSLTKPRIKAVVDWLKLEFCVDEDYSFSHPTKPFQDIRHFLKKNDINPNAYVESVGNSKPVFRVNLYDINSLKQLKKITHLLEQEYGATDFKIVTLELSLDFWNTKSIPFMLALAKSVKVSGDIRDDQLRVYKGKNFFHKMPKSSSRAIKYLNDGCTIGIGHKEEDEVYIRIYFKKVDQNIHLPLSKHRIRIEVNLKESVLQKEGLQIDNLKTLITNGFKKLQFTRLDEVASTEFKNSYTDRVQMYGRETKIISKSRNKRNLPEFVIPYRELNKTVSKAVTNLTRNFLS